MGEHYPAVGGTYQFHPLAPLSATLIHNLSDHSLCISRVRCDHCGHEYLLAFSCKGRYFCPSCHMKRVLQFSEWLTREILEHVTHQQYVLTI